MALVVVLVAVALWVVLVVLVGWMKLELRAM
jgi:hypothetical protein